MSDSSRIIYPVHTLFLCTANSARSQIAEALLRRKGGDRFVVASAGANPAREVRAEAIEALRGHGIDWSNKHPKGFDAVIEDHWDLVITLCDRARESCPALATRPISAHWGVPDPGAVEDTKARLAAFEDTINLLSWRIDLMLAIRMDQFESWVLEERLEAIAAAKRSVWPRRKRLRDDASKELDW